MSAFYVTIYPDYGFCEEHLKEIAGFWTGYEANLKFKLEASKNSTRFTQGTFTVMADTREACREAVLSAWKECFPEADIPALVITDYPVDEKLSDTFRCVHTGLYGAREYQSVASDICNIYPLIEKRDAKDILKKQSYLFAVDAGCGFTTLLSSLGNLLHDLGLFKEDGDENRTLFREFTVTKETDDEGDGTDPDDIISWLGENSDSKKYCIVGIDVSEYLNSGRNNDLRGFLRRLDYYRKDYIFAFRIPFLEQRVMDETEDLFRDLFLLKTVKIPPLNETVVIETIWDVMNATGYYPQPELIDLFLEKIHREKSDGRFYGFKTATKIGREAVLEKLMSEDSKIAQGVSENLYEIVSEDIMSLNDGKKNEKTGYDALNELIGMEKITERVKEIVAQVKISMANEKLERPSIHMRFTGAPGTGKTTVARILGQIMKEEGILRKGGFFEYTGRDLVAEYVGQTAVKTATICRDAYGSVLFIDEAYSLFQGEKNDNDYGRETIATLVAEMENHRDDMLVIMAGYTDDMENLMKANSGLRSRMPYIMDFPNYTKDQLFEIFMSMVKKHFEFEPELATVSKAFFEDLSKGYMESKEFANARFVRNLYERTWSKAALRTSLAGKTDIILTAEDFKLASGEKEFSEKIESKNRIGF